MIKYLAGDKVRLKREGSYRIVDGPTSRSSCNLAKGVVCVLHIEKSWPPDGWWHALWGKTRVFLHESDFELPCLLTTLARASAESWEL